MQTFPLPQRNGCTWPGPLRYTFGSLRALEKENRIGVRQLFAEKLDFEGITLLLTYGLRTAKPDITPRDAERLIERYIDHGGVANDLAAVCIEALSASKLLRGLGDDEPESPTPAGTEEGPADSPT